jgi:hypothetical protein
LYAVARVTGTDGAISDSTPGTANKGEIMMRKILRYVLPITLVLFVCGLEQAALSETGAASAAKAEKPDVKVGDQWKFACAEGREKSDRLWVVTSVDQSGIKGTENGQPLSLTADMNELESPRRKDTSLRQLSFPLEVGKQWNGTNKWDIGTDSGTGKESFTVLSYEKVRVPAGEFDAFKLKMKAAWSNHSGGTGSYEKTYWYAPDARTIVKYDVFSTYSPESTCELVEFKLQP